MKRWMFAVVLGLVFCFAATAHAQVSVGMHFGPRWHRPVYYAPAPVVYPYSSVLYRGPVFYAPRPYAYCGPVCQERRERIAFRRHMRWERRQFLRHERWERRYGYR